MRPKTLNLTAQSMFEEKKKSMTWTCSLKPAEIRLTLFIIMIPIDCKLQNFPYTYLSVICGLIILCWWARKDNPVDNIVFLQLSGGGCMLYIQCLSKLSNKISWPYFDISPLSVIQKLVLSGGLTFFYKEVVFDIDRLSPCDHDILLYKGILCMHAWCMHPCTHTDTRSQTNRHTQTDRHTCTLTHTHAHSLTHTCR